MKNTFNSTFKTLVVMLLSVTICFSLIFATACGDNKESSSSSSSSESTKTTYATDYQLLKNGDFEFSTFEKTNTNFPVSSSINWTLSYDKIVDSATGSNSTYPSGIIDTKADRYDAIKSDKKLPEVNPGTPFTMMAESEYVNMPESYTGEMPEDYQTEYNEDKLVSNGTKILMIHNQTSTENEGTAQRFTSSASLSLEKGEFAKLSVWIKTVDLKSAISGNDYGAYIKVENTVSSSANPFIIKNINTNGNWAKYTLYLASSDFSTSSFKLILGLGFGSNKVVQEYVEGYAFFDNANFNKISKADYELGLQTVSEKYNLYTKDGLNYVKTNANNLIADQAGKVFNDNTSDTDKFTETAFGLSHQLQEQVTYLTSYQLDGGATKNTNAMASLKDAEKIADATFANCLKANELANYVTDIKLPYELGDAKSMLIKLDNPSSYTFNTTNYSLGYKKYLKLSFWVKANLINVTGTGLTITLNDMGSEMDTTKTTKTVIASNVNTNKYENADYNDWCEYIVYVSNTQTEKDRNFFLTFDFGPANDSNCNDTWLLAKGYVAVTGFNGYYLTEEDFNSKNTSYAYAKEVELKHDLPNGTESENNDNYNFTLSSVATDSNLSEGAVNSVEGYTGIVGNSKVVGGSEQNVYTNEKITAGLINTKYDYASTYRTLGKLDQNEYIQPLMINGENAEVSYGYYGKTLTFNANTTTLVSVKVKAFDNAKANVYLVGDDYQVLTLNGYVYDDANHYEIKVENDKPVTSFAKALATTVESSAVSFDNGWTTVMFLVTTGNTNIDYRIELWNGNRDGNEHANGVVLFDAVTTQEVSKDYFTTILTDATAQNTFTHTPKYTKVTYTDDNKNDAVKYEQPTVKDVEVYGEYLSGFGKFVSFETVDTNSTRDDRVVEETPTEEQDPEEEQTTEDTSFSWALQLTSIIIAGLLIALLLVIAVRFIIQRVNKNKSVSIAYYNRSSRENTLNKVEKLNGKKQNKEQEIKEYDYDNIENNVEEDEVTEEQATEEEQTTEQTTEEVADENAEEQVEVEDNSTEQPTENND